MQTTIDVDEDMTVNQAIRSIPGNLGVFNELGIDACCGDAATLADAAGRDGVALPGPLAEPRP